MNLFYRQWPIKTPKAAILLIHGFAEHSGRYEHVAQFFNQAGFSVYAFDLPGHGQSEGERLDIRSTDDFQQAVQQAIKQLITPLNVNWVMYGHSMGGLIATRYLCDHKEPQPDAAILSAPSLLANVPALLRVVAIIMAHCQPKFRRAMAITGEQLSTDPSVAEAYFNDPLIRLDATARFGKLLLDEQRQVVANIERLPNIPIYALHGEADTLVPPAASALLLPFDHITRVTYPEMAHECHNEIEKNQVLQDMLAWLDRL